MIFDYAFSRQASSPDVYMSMQKLHNRADCVIISSSYYVSSSSALLEALNWHKLYIDRMKQKAILMHKTIYKRTPQYLQEMFNSNEHVYNPRDSDNKLIVPRPRTDYLN